jgi:predicted acyltransferase
MSTTLLPPTEQLGTVERRPPRAVDGPKRSRERLLSLDVFRGITVAGMLLVNDPGTWSAIYPPLEHAEWNGWTPTDLVFPFFLFIVGITTHLSLSARRARGADESDIRRQILRRGAMIFLLGFLLNGFPFFTWGDVSGIADPSFLQRVVDRLYHWRIMGVLQRIGLAYMCAALLTQRASVKRVVVTAGALLLGYWVAMTMLPVPGSNGTLGGLLLDVPSGTMAAYWDRFFLDWSRFGLGNHIWSGSVTFDPEGLFSTIPAICTAMLGVLAGRWIGTNRPIEERLNGLFAAGCLAMMFGMIWNWGFPINKSIWTSSYVLFCAGLAAVSIGTIMWLVDVQGSRRWTKFFVIYGTNPLIAFMGSGLLARLIYSVIFVRYDGQRVPLESAIYQSLFASWLTPVNASLAFALCFVGLWYCILLGLYRRQIFLKV